MDKNIEGSVLWNRVEELCQLKPVKWYITFRMARQSPLFVFWKFFPPLVESHTYSVFIIFSNTLSNMVSTDITVVYSTYSMWRTNQVCYFRSNSVFFPHSVSDNMSKHVNKNVRLSSISTEGKWESSNLQLLRLISSQLSTLGLHLCCPLFREVKGITGSNIISLINRFPSVQDAYQIIS